MKKACQLVFGLFISLSSLSQKLFEPQELDLQLIYGNTKFDNAQKFSSRALSHSQYDDYTTPKTVWAVDFLPATGLYLHKRINLFIGIGGEIHKIRNDFRPEIAELIGISQKYKHYQTNILYKASIGSQFFLIGNRYKMVNLQLNTIFTLEGFIKNNTGNYIALGPFGVPTRVYDYAGNSLRIGLDLIPKINFNISQNYSFKTGAGYSFGLNKSNKRVAIFADRRGTNSSMIIFSRKESTFIFSAGLTYNLSHKPRQSLNTCNWKALKKAFTISK